MDFASQQRHQACATVETHERLLSNPWNPTAKLGSYRQPWRKFMQGGHAGRYIPGEAMTNPVSAERFGLIRQLAKPQEL